MRIPWFPPSLSGAWPGIWLLALAPGILLAHPIGFSSTITYASAQPSGAAGSVSNWAGAAFDAANIGGSGANADGGSDNGAANDASTYVANNQPVQGQTFTTGGNANGYDVTGITVRMTGYANNTATGSNLTSWNLNFTNGPIILTVGKINGTTQSTVSMQCFTTGGTGNPGSGSSANGTGTFLTFTLPFPVHLDPNTTYGFDFIVGNGCTSYFEWLGTSADPYAGGAAYTRSGRTITPLSGDRVFLVDMTASTAAYAPFTHPGALHTQADFDRMKAKIAANAEPWISDYNILVNSPWAQTWWPAYDVDYIVRGSSGNNYTRSQQDAQAIYELALRWKLTGDASYADHAVAIANVWSGLLGVTGDTNQSLAAGICGYLFATGGEILSTYSGWAAADKQAYKDMMLRVFYPSNLDFLWRHHDTFWRTGGNTHYRLNWDADNIASMAAIGILCDNRAVYQQALDFFKYGPGNGRVERAAWYIHPDGTAQTEESGRDQAHNLGGWYAFALLCQMAWNQGDDLFGYDNNRVLRAFEYNAKYNLGNENPWVYHRNSDLTYTEMLSGASRGLGQYYSYELVYNHYANVKGIAAPWSKRAMQAVRPEPRPDTSIHPSQVDWLGLGSLTFARDDATTSAAPSGLVAQWSRNQVVLTWWGSATATSYQIQRATSSGGPYATIGSVAEPALNFTDANVINGASYFYKVVAVTPGGNLESAPLQVSQSLVTRYTFENTANDTAGARNATAKGGTSAPGYATGYGGGKAISLNGSDQYVQLPAGSGNYRDITIATWVYWNGGNAWQRVFDFGSEMEKYMMLTVRNGSGKVQFQMTTSRGADGTLTLVGPTMPTATWTHVAVTINGDTATMYVNGVPVASNTATMVSPMLAQPFCYLGKSMWTADPIFNGRIDDFRIYNYELTGATVYNLWGGSANHPPTFTSNPIALPAATQDVDYGSLSQTLASSASDADGGVLTYTKVSGPAWLNVANNGALSGAPANGDVGKNSFVVRVTDSSGATDDANVYITVNNVNDTPAWLSSSLTKPVVTVGQAYTYSGASLAGDATDLDTAYGDTLTFTKISGPAWLTVAADGTLSGSPSAGDAGVSTFTVRVTDASGAFSDIALSITVLPPTLCSEYAFENDTNDTIGGFNGTSTGSPAFAAGRLGKALALDAVDDFVSLPADVASYRDITVAGFVRWNGGGSWQRIFDFGNGTTQYLSLTPSNGSNMRFEIANGGAYQQIYAPALPAGRWVHVAVTISGGVGTIYVDGSPVATNTNLTIHPDDFRPSANYLGKSQYSADPLFNGELDDFRIYNYALGAGEVFDIANPIPEAPSGLATTGLQAKVVLTWNFAQAAQTYTVKRALSSGGPYTAIASGITATSYSDTGLTNGVTCYYVVSATNAKGESANSPEIAGTPSDLLLRLKFDETDATVAADSSGNGYDAALVNGPTFGAGRVGSAVSFASASSQYATLPGGLVSTLGDFTITAWVNAASLSTWSRIFDFGSGTTNYMFLTPQYSSSSAGKLRFAIRTSSAGEQQLSSSTAMTANTWNHIAVTLSGGTAKLYLNGNVVATNTGMTLTPSSLGTTSLNYLGRSQFAADPYFNGAIDDFRIYSRALSASEIEGFQSSLTIPQGLAATAGPEQVALSWTAVANAMSYTLKRAPASGGPYTTVANITGTSCTDTGLTDGAAYFYVVSAANTAGTSPDSAEVSAMPLSGLMSWRQSHFGTIADSGSAANLANPAGDGVVNLLKYALGLDPAISSAAEMSAKLPQLGVSGGALTLTFPRLRSELTYTVLASADLKTWTTLATNPGAVGQSVVVTDTDTASATRYLRLSVTDGSSTAATVPLGRLRLSLPSGQTTAIAFPLNDVAGAIAGQSAGFITAVGASTLDNANAGWTAGALSQAAAPYFLRITSGVAAGRMFPVSTTTANTASQLTLVTGGVDLSTLGIIEGADTYELFPADTLASLLPAGTLQSGSPATADLLRLWNGAAWVTYYHDGAHWLRDGLGTIADNTILRPDQGWLALRRGANATLTLMGRAPATRAALPVQRGLANFVSVLPVSATFAELGVQSLPGWGSNASNVAAGDYVAIWNGAAWLRYYHDGSQWIREGIGNADAAVLAQPGRPFFIVRPNGSGSSVFTQPLPY
jgi:fibronectin type 3 domain-containing protein